jgi:hypothetical protein
MRIFDGPVMAHIESEKAVAEFVSESLRTELAATGLSVSASPEFNRPGGSANGKSLRNAEVDRIVFARINYFGFVSPVPERHLSKLGAYFSFGVTGLLLEMQNSRRAAEGVSLDDDRPSAHAYVDVDLWVVNPQSGEVVWADTARDKQTMGVVRGAIRDDVESFLAGTLFVALNRAIWRADFLAAMGATLVPTNSAGEPDHEERARALFSAGRFGAAASAFKKAYEARPDPALLFNMALCYRKGGFAKLALWSYEQYLIKVPNSPQRATVEQRIAELKSEIGEK